MSITGVREKPGGAPSGRIVYAMSEYKTESAPVKATVVMRLQCWSYHVSTTKLTGGSAGPLKVSTNTWNIRNKYGAYHR